MFSLIMHIHHLCSLSRSREIEALGTVALASHLRVINVRDKNTSSLGHWYRTPEQPFSPRCGKLLQIYFSLSLSSYSAILSHKKVSFFPLVSFIQSAADASFFLGPISFFICIHSCKSYIYVIGSFETQFTSRESSRLTGGRWLDQASCCTPR